MPRQASPFDLWKGGMELTTLLVETQLVMGYRMLGMAGLWAVSPGENRRMIAEKGPAFTEAAMPPPAPPWPEGGPTRSSVPGSSRCAARPARTRGGWAVAARPSHRASARGAPSRRKESKMTAIDVQMQMWRASFDLWRRLFDTQVGNRQGHDGRHVGLDLAGRGVAREVAELSGRRPTRWSPRRPGRAARPSRRAARRAGAAGSSGQRRGDGKAGTGAAAKRSTPAPIRRPRA